MSGLIAVTVDAGGSVILELTADSGNFTWVGRGVVLDSLISGQWQSSYSAVGGFTAKLRPLDVTGSDNGFRDFSHLEVTPAAPALLPNEMIDLDVAPRDRFGSRMGSRPPCAIRRYRYTAVFTLKRDKQGPELGGTFSDV